MPAALGRTSFLGTDEASEGPPRAPCDNRSKRPRLCDCWSGCAQGVRGRQRVPLSWHLCEHRS
eukprot:15367927-Alexandrium_andersonii.AAC.1